MVIINTTQLGYLPSAHKCHVCVVYTVGEQQRRSWFCGCDWAAWGCWQPAVSFTFNPNLAGKQTGGGQWLTCCDICGGASWVIFANALPVFHYHVTGAVAFSPVRLRLIKVQLFWFWQSTPWFIGTKQISVCTLLADKAPW